MPAIHDDATQIRVLLVDDHALVRAVLSRVLADFPGLQIVGEASNGSDAIDLADRLHPDVILMDINMPHPNGIEATRQIKSRDARVGVIALSASDDPELAASMRAAGAGTFLTKDAPVEDLYAAIRGMNPAKDDPG